MSILKNSQEISSAFIVCRQNIQMLVESKYPRLFSLKNKIYLNQLVNFCQLPSLLACVHLKYSFQRSYEFNSPYHILPCINYNQICLQQN